MSRHDHKHDPKLKALLDQQKKQQLPADDFEREAAEGFAMLVSEQEALDLKAELDQQMQHSLSPAPKAAPARIYLMAAAGLALVIGLSAWLILAQDSAMKEEKDLAITTSVPLSYADSVRPAEQSFEQKAAKLSSAEPQAQSSPGTGRPEEAPRKIQAGGAGAQHAAPVMESALAAEAEQAAPPAAKPDANADKAGEADKNGPDLQGFASNQFGADAKDVNDAMERPKAQEKRAEPAKAKKLEGFTPSVKYAHSAAATVADTAANTCYYEGGTALLKQDLTQRLAEKKLNVHFEATLFIGGNERVQRVEFTKKDQALSQGEQDEIIKILKSLDKFRLPKKVKLGDFCEYRVGI